MKTTGKRQGSTALKIRNTGPQMDTFLTMMEGEQSQRATKRRLLLWRLGCIPGRPQMCQGCTGYTKATRSHVIRCSGVEAKIKELRTGLISHQELKQDSHTWLDVILNDIESIKKPEVWEAVREGVGALEEMPWANPRSRKGWKIGGP